MIVVLRDLQQAMQVSVLEDNGDVADVLVEPNNMTASERLQVYRHGYYLRLIDILEGDFTVLRDIMGEAAFAAMARDYLDAYPSHHFSVRTVGRHMVKFLKNTKNCDPCYRELAKFEWALNQALFAKDMPILTMDMLAAVPPEQWAEMHLYLHPSVQIMCCQYNTVERWQRINEEHVDKGMLRLVEPIYHMIWRHDNDANFCLITKGQRHLMQALQQEQNFTALCETMLLHIDEQEVVQWVAGTLQEWVRQSVFVSVTAT